MKAIAKVFIYVGLFATSMGGGLGIEYARFVSSAPQVSTTPSDNNDDVPPHIPSPSEKLLENVMSKDGLYASGNISLDFNEVTIGADVSLNICLKDLEHISLNADIDLTLNDSTIPLSVGYFDGTLTFDALDSHFKMTTDDIFDFIDMLPTLGISLNEVKALVDDEPNNDEQENPSEGGFNLDIDLDSFLESLDSLTEEDKVLHDDGKYYFPVSFLDNQLWIQTSEGDEDEFKGIKVEEFTFENIKASINVDLEPKDDDELNIVNPLEGEDAEQYSDFKKTTNFIEAITKLVDQKAYNIEFNAIIDKKDESLVDMTFDGNIQFDLENKFGYGYLHIIDGDNYDHMLRADMKSEEEILFEYNNKMRGKFTIKTLGEIKDIVVDLLNNPDKHFAALFDKFLGSMGDSPINQVIDGNYGLLLDYGVISNIKIEEKDIDFDLNLNILGLDVSLAHVNIKLRELDDSSLVLSSLTISDVDVGDAVISATISVSEYDSSKEEGNRLDPSLNYMNFSDIKVLLQLGLKTSQFEYYHIGGKASFYVDLPAINNIKVNVPLDIQVRLSEDGLEVDVELEEIPLYFGVNKQGVDTRNAAVYYKDGYIYASRHETEQVNVGSFFSPKYETVHYNYSRRCTPDYFMDNIVTILCDDLLGLVPSILDRITAGGDEEEKDVQMIYEDIISNFIYTEGEQVDKIDLGIGLYALTNNDIFKKDLYATITSDTTKSIIKDIHADLTLSVGVNLILTADLSLQDDCSVELNDSNKLTRLINFTNAHKNDTLNERIQY